MKASVRRRARRPSRQYEAVAAVLASAQRPLSANELLQRARRRCPTLGIATVYRALRALSAAALVRQLHTPAGSVCYEAACRRSHDHLYCTHCQHLHCVHSCRVVLQRSDARQVRVTGRDLLLYGTCAKCSVPARRCRDN